MKIEEFLSKYRIGKKEIIFISFLLTGTLLLIFFTFAKLNKKRDALNLSSRYTVAVTIGKFKNIRTPSPRLDYKFTIGGIKYGGSENFIDDGSINFNGGKYYVRYQPEDPTNNEILLEYPVPPSIALGNIPDSGWEKIPK